MASTASTILRQELMATGENSATWGTKTNTNLGILESAIAGTTSISTTGGTTTLTNVDYTNDQSKKAVLDVSGALTSNAIIVIPNASRVYKVFNRTTEAGSSTTVSIKTSSGTAITIARTTSCEVYCNGSNVMRYLTPMADYTTGAPSTSSGAAASSVSVTPSGNLSSTNVQAALSELQGDINTINSTLPASYQPLAARLTEFSTLGVGTTGYALIADSGVSANMKWAPLIPAGTDVLMYELSVTGWSVNTSNTNCAVRIVTGSGGTFTAGSAFSTVFTARSISTANLPAHTHTFSDTATTSSGGTHTHTMSGTYIPDGSTGGAGTYFMRDEGAGSAYSGATDIDSGGAHTHTVSVSGTTSSVGSGTAMDFAVAYVNVAIFTKSAY